MQILQFLRSTWGFSIFVNGIAFHCFWEMCKICPLLCWNFREIFMRYFVFFIQFCGICFTLIKVFNILFNVVHFFFFDFTIFVILYASLSIFSNFAAAIFLTFVLRILSQSFTPTKYILFSLIFKFFSQFFSYYGYF